MFKFMNVMYCILFEFTINILKYVVKYLFLFFCTYLRVPVDILYGYPDGYEYEYRYVVDIYTASKVRGSYYPYPIRPVDIPK